MQNKEIQKLANNIRILATDAIFKAQSGHLGTPLGAADVMACLYANHLNFNPKNPQWCNRDRFILSAGHACAMLYSTLHLMGSNKFSMDALKSLRQLHSVASGHPERNLEAGIEVTTGPLGEGIAMAVGIAMAEKILNAKYESIIDNLTYVLVGDGCLMEGASYEALAIAGTFGLKKLVIIYDKNDITIDGSLKLASNENIRMRMEACGFNVLEIDGHNYDEINQAFNQAKNNAKTGDKPTFIISNTKIGYGIKNIECKSSAHGFAVNTEDIAQMKQDFGFNPQESFVVSEEVKVIAQTIQSEKLNNYNLWQAKLATNSNKESFENFINLDFANIFKQQNIHESLQSLANDYIKNKPAIATRVASGKVLEILTNNIPNFIGGSADLSSSNNTINKNSIVINKNNGDGNYIHYGVREHAMACIMNGLSCYNSGFLPYGGTFLVFSDFMRPSIRLSALMEVPVIYVFTHDNITLGGDGPTHQPIEHIDSLRLIPNLEVLRPCDLIETIEAYEIALENKNKPTALILGRGNVPAIREKFDFNNNQVKKGGYIIKANDKSTINLISAGSELSLLLEVEQQLKQHGIIANIISMPSIDRFALQSKEYQNSVLTNNINYVIEAKRISGYSEILQNKTFYYDIKRFGESAEAKDLLEYFGFTSDKIIEFILKSCEN